MARMNLILSVLVYALIAAVLCGGILAAMAGKPLFLIVTILVYIVAFGKIGCCSH